MQQLVMAPAGKTRKGGPVPLARLLGQILDPVTARRGFAAADLMTMWSDIVGARYADCSRPERIVWPRGAANDSQAGTLVIRADGPRALLLQHETTQIIERVNGFLGHGAVATVKIVQGPVNSHGRPAERPADELDDEGKARLAGALATVEEDALRAALDRLGRAVMASSDKKS